jgi:hypothetical protein
MIFRPHGIMGYREVPYPGDLFRRGRRAEALERRKSDAAAGSQSPAEPTGSEAGGSAQ